ncbi:MAG: hypothetical protein PVH53_02220 [Desulfobacterales bacterium]
MAFLGASDTASRGFLTTGTGLGSGILTAGFSGGFFTTGSGFAGAGAGPPAGGPEGSDTRLTLTTPDRNRGPDPNSGIKINPPIRTKWKRNETPKGKTSDGASGRRQWYCPA